MNYTVIYLPQVKEDVAKLGRKPKDRIRKAIEDRLVKDPGAYGKPLKKTLKGYFRLRVEIDVLKEEIKMLWVLVISSGAASFKMFFKFSEIYFSGKEWTLGAKLHFIGAIFCFALTVLALIGIIKDLSYF